MTNPTLREYIADILPEAIIFDNPSFDNSIVGTTDNQIVYNFDKMIEEMATDEGITQEDAQEFIEYNTIRAIPYMGSNHPIILYPIMEQ